VGIDSFDSSFEFFTVEHDAALAPQTPDTYVGTKPDYLPIIATAGVLFLQPDYVTEFYVQDHYFLLFQTG
jgi:hypothetical protein